jgi:CHAT domain-containing protein/tetratricopeptide (TPR) repeat protein
MANMNLHRRAERRLLASLSPPGGRPPRRLDADSYRLAVLLTEVYYRSKQYQSARAWADRSFAYFDTLPRLNKRHTSDRHRVWVASADVHRELGGPKGLNTAYQILHDAEIWYRTASLGFLHLRLDAQLRMATLAAQRGHDSLVEKLLVSVAASRPTLDALHDARRITDNEYVDGMLVTAQAMARLDRHEDASAALRQLLELGKDPDATREEVDPLVLKHRFHIWRKIAQVERQAEKFTAEAAALNQAIVQLDALEKLQDGSTTTIDRAQIMLDRGDVTRRLVVAADDAKKPEHATGYLRYCLKLYQQTLDIVRKDLRGNTNGRRETEHNELLGHQLIALQRRQEAAQQLLGRRNSKSPLTVDRMIEFTSDLYEVYQRELLIDDPRAYRIKTALGGYYVKVGEYAKARDILADTTSFWERCTPPDHRMLVRSLNLLGEVERVNGNLSRPASSGENSENAAKVVDRTASSLLNQAMRIVEQHLPDDHFLWLSVKINLGRLEASKGIYQAALDHFDAAIERAKSQPGTANESYISALLNKGLLFKSLLRFKEAITYCERALAMRQQFVDENHPDLLPHYVALGSLYISKRDPDALRDQVRKSAGIIQQHWGAAIARGERPPPLVAIVQHQEAMTHFLQSEKETNHQKKSSHRLAARRIWQELLAAGLGNHPLPLQARTMHYLARVDYLDWAQASLQWQKQFQLPTAGQSEIYDDRLSQYERRVSAYETNLISYRQDRSNYLGRLKRYDPAQIDTAKQEYTALANSRDALNRRSRELVAQQGRLRVARETLKTDLAKAMQRRRELQAMLEKAERQAAKAVEILRPMLVLPNLRYIALCSHAEMLHALGHWYRTDDADLRRLAIAEVEEAVALIETPRASTFGGDIVRSQFFARYATAFDLLVQWHVESGDVRSALVAAERGRNRTFLDQIRADDVSIEDDLAPEDRPLVRQYHEALTEQNILAARLTSLLEKPASRLAASEKRLIPHLKSKLKTARHASVSLRGKIYDRGKKYRDLVRANFDTDAVARLVDSYEQTREFALYYRVGNRQSYLFVLGDGPPQVFPLKIPREPTPPDEFQPGDVSESVVKAVVRRYRARFSNPEIAHSTITDPSGLPLRRLALLSRVLLPEKVIEILAKHRQQGRDHITVMPDASLYQLPLESLVIEPGMAPRYLLDVCPPIAYAPSLLIMQSLKQRRGSGVSGHLLSIGDPKYLPSQKGRGDPAARNNSPLRFRDGQGHLQRLVHSGEEVDRVVTALQNTAGQSVVTKLVQNDATEEKFRQHVEQRKYKYLHVAAHGIVSDAYANLFGAIALTVPGTKLPPPQRDGYLQLHEIHGLPLSGCELAALSACNTDIEPSRPRHDDEKETSAGHGTQSGFTFARAFLSAGARRVVSTQWRVADQSTTELTGAFFEEIGASLVRGERVNYARALYEARRKLRHEGKDKGWDSPFYWGPFVLVGPAL